MKKNTISTSDINIFFTAHALERRLQRNLNSYDIALSLEKALYNLCNSCNSVEPIILINQSLNHSLVLKVLKTNDTYLFKFITVMNFIPMTQSGHYKFYNYSHLYVV